MGEPVTQSAVPNEGGHSSWRNGQPDTMSIRELASRLGIGKSAVYELAQRDELPVPTIRVGRQYKFSRRAVEALLGVEKD